MKLAIRPISGELITLNSFRRRLVAAFTFAEVLAALVFMAIVIPVAIEGMQIANRAGVAAQRKGVAIQLANKQLQEIIGLGTWRNNGQSGNFTPYWKDYRWRFLNEPWKEDPLMRQLTLTVIYLVQNKEYEVRLSTLMQDTPQ